MVATPEKPLGRSTIRKTRPGTPSNRVRLWTLPAPAGSTAEKLLGVYLGAFKAVDGLEGAKAAIASNPELTEAGQRKQFRDAIFRETIPAMQRGRIVLAQARQEAAARRAQLVPPKADPADVAGAMRRQETRALLRSMTEAQRKDFLRKNGSHPEIRQAVIEQPASHSGMLDTKHDQMISEAMQDAYAPQLAELRDLEEAIDIAASAIGAGREEAHSEAAALDPDLRDPDKFAAAAATVEAKMDAPWLQTFKENGAEVIRAVVWEDDAESRGAWTVATPEQIANGILAKTRDEYDRLKGTAVVDFSGETAEEARRKRAAFVDEHGHEAYLSRNSGTAA